MSNDSIDCINHYDYVITKDNVSEPFSPYKIYFHVNSQDNGARKTIRLIANLGNPISLSQNLVTANQIIPTFYQWHLVFAQGRNWYINFFQEPDGFYSSTLELAQAEWRASSLCVFFQDVNNDGTDDNLVFRIIIKDFVNLPPTPEDQISAYLQAAAQQDRTTAIALWQMPDTSDEQFLPLKSRREQTTQQLISAKIQPDYAIGWQEGWVGGESVRNTSLDSAWLARVTVSLSTETGENLDYVFDLLNKEYETVSDGYHQDWVIVDVYPKGEQPYFWEGVLQP